MALRHGRMRLFEVRIRPCGHNSVKTARFDKSPERELSDLGFSGLMQRILKSDCFFSALATEGRILRVSLIKYVSSKRADIINYVPTRAEFFSIP